MLPPLAWAGLGVVAFSLTFPATIFALRGFDATLVGAGRSVLAALIAGTALRVARVPLPRRAELPGLLGVATGCGIGFGVLSAVALRHVTASHAAVIIGVLPAATAAVAVLRAGERPGWLFWTASAAGSCAVVAYALSRGAGHLRGADLLLLAALMVGAVGYAEGGRLARARPGWQVIAWGIVLALPVSLPITVVALIRTAPHPTASAIAGLAYVSVVSMFVGFIAWYRGLAEAGIAKASQIQLVQPILTICWSVPLLGESAGPSAVLTALIVAVCVLLTQRSRQPDHRAAHERRRTASAPSPP